VIMRAVTESPPLGSWMTPIVVVVAASCVWALVGLIALSDAFAEETQTRNIALPEPFAMTLEAKRPTLPEPFAMTLEANKPPLPEPFAMTLEANKPPLPEPFAMTLEANKPPLPEPFAMTLEANKLPLPEPFAMTLEATRPKPCEGPNKEFTSAVGLTDKGQFGAAKQALDKIDTKPCPGLTPKIAAERTRIADLIAKAAAVAQTALDACKFKASRKLIDDLPEGPARAALVAKWNKAYATESKAFELVHAASALKKQGLLKQAIEKLREARGLKPCDKTIASIDEAIRSVQSQIAEAEANKIEAALSACKFKTSRQLIKQLPEGPAKAALVARWNKAYETESKARDLIVQAKAFEQRGLFSKAILKLHQARDLGPCESTISAIDRAIVRILERSEKATRECRAQFGQHAIVDPKAPLEKCSCRSGYKMREVNGETQCRRVRSREDIMAGGHKDCRTKFGDVAYAIRQNKDGTFKCGCRGIFSMKVIDGKTRCASRKDIMAEGHKDCRTEFGNAAYAIRRNRDGTFKCGCRGNFSMLIVGSKNRCVGNDRIMAEGHKICRNNHGVGSYATRYLGNNRWNCHLPQPKITGGGERRKCPPTHILMNNGKCLDRNWMGGIGKAIQGLGKRQPTPRSCGFARDCRFVSSSRKCNAGEWARWRAFLACKGRSR